MQIIRTKTATTERLTLLLPSGAITIEVSVRGLELDATTTEWMLHAPLSALARITAERVLPGGALTGMVEQ